MDEMLILADSREQKILPLSVPYKVTGLYTADYSLASTGGISFEHRFGVERKSICDCTASLASSNRARFMHELSRMSGLSFKRLLITGTRAQIENHEYRSKASPASILGSLAAIEVRYNVPVVWAGDEATGAKYVETWAKYFWREHYLKIVADHAKSLD